MGSVPNCLCGRPIWAGALEHGFDPALAAPTRKPGSFFGVKVGHVPAPKAILEQSTAGSTSTHRQFDVGRLDSAECPTSPPGHWPVIAQCGGESCIHIDPQKGGLDLVSRPSLQPSWVFRNLILRCSCTKRVWLMGAYCIVSLRARKMTCSEPDKLFTPDNASVRL